MLGESSAPLITIVTVVYNSAAALEETIRSVQALVYDNLEYLVIDGCSSDGTVEVIKKHPETVTYWISEKDSGIYDAMNKGWAACKEDSYILFLGAGDTVLSLPQMRKYSRHDVVCGTVRLGDGRAFVSKGGAALRLRNSVHHQALLIHKSVHPDPPFDTRFRIFADFDLNQRLLRRGLAFVYDDAFVSYAMPEGVSARYDLGEALRVVHKNFGCGWTALSLGYFLARRLFVKSKALFLRCTRGLPCAASR